MYPSKIKIMYQISDPHNINTCNSAVEEILPDLELIDDIIKGERVLVKKSNIYLPQDPTETEGGYLSRLKRASLTNYVKKVRDVATTMVLSKPFVLENDKMNYEEFVTKDGQDLKSFSRMLLRSAWQDGFSLLLVDYPKVENEIKSLAQQNELGLRPYFSVIKRKDLMDWRTELKVNEYDGQKYYLVNLSCLKIKVSIEGQMAIMEYKTTDTFTEWKLWELVEVTKTKKEWVNTESGQLSISVIPVAPIYIEQECFLEAALPLIGIANLTKHHFTVSSDLFQLLHLIANPRLLMAGVDREEVDFSASSNFGLIFEAPDARMEWVSLTGVNTTPLEAKLEKIEETILSSVLQIFQPKKQAESGIAKEIDREQNNGLLIMAANGLENCLNNAFMIAAGYNNETPAKVSINSEFYWGSLNAQDVQSILNLFLSDAITQETLLKKLQVKGYFDGVEDFDIETELNRLQ